MIRTMATFKSYHVTCNQEISIPTDKMTMHLLNGSNFDVPIPQSHIGTQVIKARLIAPFRTKDMTCQCRCLLVCSCIKVCLNLLLRPSESHCRMFTNLPQVIVKLVKANILVTFDRCVDHVRQPEQIATLIWNICQSKPYLSVHLIQIRYKL